MGVYIWLPSRHFAYPRNSQVGSHAAQAYGAEEDKPHGSWLLELSMLGIEDVSPITIRIKA